MALYLIIMVAFTHLEENCIYYIDSACKNKTKLIATFTIKEDN